MDGRRAVVVAFAGQIDRHAPITIDTIVLMVDFANLSLDFFFMGIVICLPVFPVVVVCVRINVQPVQKPANTEFAMILIDKSISL